MTTVCDIAQFHSPLGGGVKRYLHDKRRHLTALPGGRHVLIVPSHRDAVTATPEGHVTYEIESPLLPGSKSYRALIARQRILEAVARERPDVVEVGDPYRTAWVGLEAARRIGVPAVAFYHSDFPRAIGRTVARFAGAWAERALSAPIQRYLVRLYNRMDATVVATRRFAGILGECGVRGIVHVPLGTDTATFRPRHARERVRREFGLGPDDHARLLLFVGRLAREKNVRQLVHALDLLDGNGPPCRLVLVGDGELDSWVREECARRPGQLTWLPYCESADRLADLYSAADWFVHAGRQETFSIVSLEAQACGTPVLAVRGGGLEESLSTEPEPLFAADGTAAALAAALEIARHRPFDPAERLARARRLAAAFGIEQTFRRLFALYAHLAGGGTAESFALPPTPEASSLAPDHALPRPPLRTR